MIDSSRRSPYEVKLDPAAPAGGRIKRGHVVVIWARDEATAAQLMRKAIDEGDPQ